MMVVMVVVDGDGGNPPRLCLLLLDLLHLSSQGRWRW